MSQILRLFEHVKAHLSLNDITIRLALKDTVSITLRTVPTREPLSSKYMVENHPCNHKVPIAIPSQCPSYVVL